MSISLWNYFLELAALTFLFCFALPLSIRSELITKISHPLLERFLDLCFCQIVQDAVGCALGEVLQPLFRFPLCCCLCHCHLAFPLFLLCYSKVRQRLNTGRICLLALWFGLYQRSLRKCVITTTRRRNAFEVKVWRYNFQSRGLFVEFFEALSAKIHILLRTLCPRIPLGHLLQRTWLVRLRSQRSPSNDSS